MLRSVKHMFTVLSVVLCIHWDNTVSCTKNHGVFSCTKGNETLEKETNPYLVTLLLMYLAECLPHSGPTFFKVPSLLRASASLFLNHHELDSISAGWSHFLIARTNRYISPGFYKPLALMAIPSPWNHWFLYWLLVFLLPLWLPLLSVSNKLFFCLLWKHSWPLGFSSWTESILYMFSLSDIVSMLVVPTRRTFSRSLSYHFCPVKYGMDCFVRNDHFKREDPWNTNIVSLSG